MIQYRSNIEDYNGVQAVVENVDFFETGCGLVPVNMSEVARALDPHTSTMSRAVQDKYIVCAAGTVALKSLFEKGVPGISGKTVSKTLAKQQIVQFISKEDASNPLSDKDLILFRIKNA